MSTLCSITRKESNYTRNTTELTERVFRAYPTEKVKSMQRSGNEAIRNQPSPQNPKREITNITNSQNTKRTYSQPSEQLFPKRLPLSIRTEHQKQATENHNKTTALERSVFNYWGLKLALRAQPHPQFLKWYETFDI